MLKQSLILCSALTVFACGGTPTEQEQTEPAVLDPTFARVYQEIIQPGCGCHTGGTAGGLAMPNATAAHAALVEAPATNGGPCDGETRVISGDAQSSVLYRKLSGANLCGSAMPQGGPTMSAEKLALVEAWIGAGAVNN